ncbi:MAG: heavy metal-binding domain-containing protein [Ginsengibacter sp.]
MKSLKMLMIAALTILTISAFAQNKTIKKATISKQKSEKVKYTCTMHPDVLMDEFGKCPKCGMDLTKSTKEQMKMDVMKMYTCPMHPEVAMDKSGKCPKCGMDLKETEMAYTCPMHPEVTGSKSDKCPKCGMALNLSPKEKMKMEVMKIYSCPMHADVTSSEPGKCSKCGMALSEHK